MDPTGTGAVAYGDFVAVAALVLEQQRRRGRGGADEGEVEEAFRLFLDAGEEESGDGEKRITMAGLRRVARGLGEEGEEGMLRDMILEANGGDGVGSGVGLGEFEGVMRRAGVFR